MATSYSNIHGEWENRKISIWGAARAFISQLGVGQDMTRVTIPALFLRPYSVLEEITTRSMGNLDIILNISETKDPQERMKLVVQWLAGSARAENFNHKPYNPVIGEEHKARVNFGSDGMVFGVAEQVRHHPPISAFQIVAPTKNFSIEGNTNFSVTFNGNSVTVSMLGEIRIIVKLENGEEEIYTLSKCVPNILIKNVIWGTKYVLWDGPIDINCEKTGFSATLMFAFKKNLNTIDGDIFKQTNNGKQSVLQISGATGHEVFIWPTKDKKQKTLLCDSSKVKPMTPEYPKLSEMPPNSSIKLWGEVSEAIIANDMVKADEKKTAIEQAQRNLATDRGQEEFIPKYFHEVKPNVWKIKNPEWYLSSPEINPDARM